MTWLDDNFTTDTVDESMNMDGHTGAATRLNAASGSSIGAAKSLVILWFVLLGVYWALGTLFKGQLS